MALRKFVDVNAFLEEVSSEARIASIKQCEQSTMLLAIESLKCSLENFPGIYVETDNSTGAIKRIYSEIQSND